MVMMCLMVVVNRCIVYLFIYLFICLCQCVSRFEVVLGSFLETWHQGGRAPLADCVTGLLNR